MSPSTLLFCTLLTFMHLLTLNLAQLEGCTQSAEYCWDCSNSGSHSANIIYQKNLNNLLLSMSSSTDLNANGFYNASLGQNPDKVNAIGLCRGGLAADSCQSCLNVSSYMLLNRCPNSKEAILWTELCMVRYSNASIISVQEEEPIRILSSPNEAADAQQFKVALKPLLDVLINKAASDVHKYALGNAKVPNSDTIYALVQCTPDLSQKQCSACLEDSSLKIPYCCAGKDGARVLKPSCTLRYELRPFYNSTGSQENGICMPSAEFCWYCYDDDNDAGIGVYKENLKTLLLSFYSNKTRNGFGFYNASLGENTNRVNAIALCRGDLSPEDCRSCVGISSQTLLGRCLNRKEGILWDEKCMVRYSNNSIFSVRQDDPRIYVSSHNEAREPNSFKLTLKPLLDALIGRATSGDSLKKYASGQSSVPGYETIYGTAQCTPDLDKQQCGGCLEEAVSFVPQKFGGKQGARVLKPSCNLRYESSPFFVPTPDQQVSPNSYKGKSKTTRTVIAAVIPSVTVVILIIIGVCVCLMLRRKSSVKL